MLPQGHTNRPTVADFESRSAADGGPMPTGVASLSRGRRLPRRTPRTIIGPHGDQAGRRHHGRRRAAAVNHYSTDFSAPAPPIRQIVRRCFDNPLVSSAGSTAGGRRWPRGRWRQRRTRVSSKDCEHQSTRTMVGAKRLFISHASQDKPFYKSAASDASEIWPGRCLIRCPGDRRHR
jgi:hypothetical protein